MFLSIRVPADMDYSHAAVQQHVVGLVLADYERRILSHGTIGMMNNGQWR